MRSACASSGQISRISPSDSGSRSAAGACGGGPASISPDLNGSARVLGTVFARLVELATERGHVQRRPLDVRDDTIAVVAVRMRALELRDSRLDARDRRLHLGMRFQ